jgi:predicted amidohydrolase
MIIALASPRVASTIDQGLEQIRTGLSEAADRGAQVVCFPEAYLPGLRGMDFEVPAFDRSEQEEALSLVGGFARASGIAVVLGMEWHTDRGCHISAVVLDARGEVLGVQTKNQLDPAEEAWYVPGETRQLFEIEGVRFGVSICHEGFRYPETVRWAAVRGAHLVFHPHCTGSDRTGTLLSSFASSESPYYEKAMICRGLENTIYFASVNYAFRYQESATCLISPSGACLAQQPYGEEGVLVAIVDPALATGLLATRYAPERYPDGAIESR